MLSALAHDVANRAKGGGGLQQQPPQQLLRVSMPLPVCAHWTAAGVTWLAGHGQYGQTGTVKSFRTPPHPHPHTQTHPTVATPSPTSGAVDIYLDIQLLLISI
jgi:hypothetical protein